MTGQRYDNRTVRGMVAQSVRRHNGCKIMALAEYRLESTAGGQWRLQLVEKGEV